MDHEIYICRALYAHVRSKGAPSVGVTHMGGETHFVETRDGAVGQLMPLVCCKWALKYQVASKWLAERAGVRNL